MATDPQERADLLNQAVMLSMTFTKAGSGWTHDDWDEAMAAAGEFRALSAELVEARRERDDARAAGDAEAHYANELHAELVAAQARLARLEEALARIAETGCVLPAGVSVHRGVVCPAHVARAALSGGVAAETRDDELCPTCGSPVRVHSSAEGTSFYEPVGARREPEEPRE